MSLAPTPGSIVYNTQFLPDHAFYYRDKMFEWDRGFPIIAETTASNPKICVLVIHTHIYACKVVVSSYSVLLYYYLTNK
jgi:hypothetical protein